MSQTVILGTARTPFGKMGGALAPKGAPELGGEAIDAALERAEVGPDQVQQVIFGQEESIILGGFDAAESITGPTQLQALALGVRGPDLQGTEGRIPILPPGVSIPAFGVALNAVALSTSSNVLSTPHIIAMDNTEAEINVGSNIPLQTNQGGLGGLAPLLGGLGGQGLLPLPGGVLRERDVARQAELAAAYAEGLDAAQLGCGGRVRPEHHSDLKGFHRGIFSPPRRRDSWMALMVSTAAAESSGAQRSGQRPDCAHSRKYRTSAS